MSEKTAIKKLQGQDFNFKKNQYPNVPLYALPKTKYEDKTAKGLTKCIIDFLNLNGNQAERISSEGRVIDNRKTYTDAIGRLKTIGTVQRVYSSTTNGTADISSIIKGLSVKIEIKVGNDKQSEAQKRYESKVQSAGGIYIIAKDFQSFYDWYINRFGNEA